MTNTPVPHSSVGLSQAADAILADRAAEGDARAFSELVRRYIGLLRWYAARIVGSTGAQDDVVQDALIVAWQQLPTLTDTAAVRGWLMKITTRKALDHARTRRDHADIDDTDLPAPASTGPEVVTATSALSTALTTALATLPDNQRQVWTLRELGGYSYDEIATELTLPVTTVRGLLARARKTLLQQMNGWR